MAQHEHINAIPPHLLTYFQRLVDDRTTMMVVSSDDYLVATLCAAVFQALKIDTDDRDSDAIAQILTEEVNHKIFETEALDMSDLAGQEQLGKVITDLRGQFREQITPAYVKDFCFGLKIMQAMIKSKKEDALQKIISRTIEYVQKKHAGMITSIEDNLNRFQNILDLSNAERDLMEISYLFSTDGRTSIFRELLFSVYKSPMFYEHFFKTLLKRNDTVALNHQVADALSLSSKPIMLGIVNYDPKSKKMTRMNEYWIYSLANYAEKDSDFAARFVGEVTTKDRKTFSGAMAKAASHKDENLLRALIQAMYDESEALTSDRDEMSCNDDHKGMNVLLYGKRSLDKIGYVANILREVDLAAYEVKTKLAAAADIPAIVYISQQIMLKCKFNLAGMLIVDKAESALTRHYDRPEWMMDMFEESQPDRKTEKTSDELLLTDNPVPTIWLAHGAARISPENVGRFLFHCELKGGSRKDRKDEIETVIKKFGFSEALTQRLSKYLELNIEQVNSAARVTKILDIDADESDDTVSHLIENSQRALDRLKTEQLRESVTKYDLSLLNLRGSMPVEKIITALKKKPQGSLCFWGLPGSGKTQLAEHIAVALDMPIIIKPASELLSKWLGESEQNIAAAFEEAKQEGAILLLDEADSFLRSREGAQRSWEITQVNELLQKMERFEGIFICTTNLFKALDPAALRRFTFKIEFLAMSIDQRIKMLCNEVNMKLDDLNDADRNRVETDLMMMQYLTPGDFATVKRQANLLEEQLTVEQWLQRLQVEQEAKLAGLREEPVTGHSVPRGTIIPPNVTMR